MPLTPPRRCNTVSPIVCEPYNTIKLLLSVLRDHVLHSTTVLQHGFTYCRWTLQHNKTPAFGTPWSRPSLHPGAATRFHLLSADPYNTIKLLLLVLRDHVLHSTPVLQHGFTYCLWTLQHNKTPAFGTPWSRPSLPPRCCNTVSPIVCEPYNTIKLLRSVLRDHVLHSPPRCCNTVSPIVCEPYNTIKLLLSVLHDHVLHSTPVLQHGFTYCLWTL